MYLSVFLFHCSEEKTVFCKIFHQVHNFLDIRGKLLLFIESITRCWYKGVWVTGPATSITPGYQNIPRLYAMLCTLAFYSCYTMALTAALYCCSTVDPYCDSLLWLSTVALFSGSLLRFLLSAGSSYCGCLMWLSAADRVTVALCCGSLLQLELLWLSNVALCCCSSYCGSLLWLSTAARVTVAVYAALYCGSLLRLSAFLLLLFTSSHP